MQKPGFAAGLTRRDQGETQSHVIFDPAFERKFVPASCN